MEHGELSAELIERMDRDQLARAELVRGLTGRTVHDEVWARVCDIDIDNTAWFAGVLDRHGWPRRSEVGADASTAAWLIAQHADLDPEFQRRCLRLLEQAVHDGEAQPSHLAYLTDRVLRAQDRPQLYGTQFWYEDDGSLQPQPIADPEHLDERRHSVGLGPFAEHVSQIRQRESDDRTDDETGGRSSSGTGSLPTSS
ncbi:hypothetical protein GCM10027290_18650 [Micromonospora sonneratiae]|uniref:DUF6624 domain-containing protein n=1 Tax=Micromonospora sonneratiae TaxID=1184706 RepID=A0ABW3YAN7_9ACTN